MAEKTIPLLPCQTIQPVIDFYTALGFEVTFLQKSPNPFAVVERGDIELQFFGMKKYEPSESYSTCYVLTDDVDGLYEAFRAGLKAAYGKSPEPGHTADRAAQGHVLRGAAVPDDRPRRQLRPGRPAHQRGPAPPARPQGDLREGAAQRRALRRLQGGSRRARRRSSIACSGSEDERPTPAQLVRLLVLRGDVAGRLGDETTAVSALERAAAVQLTDEERESVRDDLARLKDLAG